MNNTNPNLERAVPGVDPSGDANPAEMLERELGPLSPGPEKIPTHEEHVANMLRSQPMKFRDELPKPEPTLFGNPLNAFDNGCELDLRAKLAIEFLKTPGLYSLAPQKFGDPVGSSELATFALDLAAAVIDQAGDRGWVKPLAEDDQIPENVKREISRSVRATVHQQMEGQRIVQEEAPRVQQGIPGGVVRQ